MPRKKKQQDETVAEVTTTETDISEAEATEEVIPVSAAEGNSDSDRMRALEEQVRTLTQALLLSRQEVPAKTDDATIGITRTGGGRLIMTLSDAHGRDKNFVWESVGDTVYLTDFQYEEFLENPAGPKFLERGFLTMEEEASKHKSAERLIKELSADELAEHIQEITDTARLLEILNYIESARIQTVDPETGKTYVDSEGFPRAEVLPLDGKHQMAATLCADRAYELTGVRYLLTDG